MAMDWRRTTDWLPEALASALHGSESEKVFELEERGPVPECDANPPDPEAPALELGSAPVGPLVCRGTAGVVRSARKAGGPAWAR